MYLNSPIVCRKVVIFSSGSSLDASCVSEILLSAYGVGFGLQSASWCFDRMALMVCG